MTTISAGEFTRRLERLTLSGVGPGLPRRREDAEILLRSIALSISREEPYTEPELRFALLGWLDAAGPRMDIDAVSLRRHLVDSGYLVRDKAGRSYHVVFPTETIVAFDRDVEQLQPERLMIACRERAVWRALTHRRAATASHETNGIGGERREIDPSAAVHAALTKFLTAFEDLDWERFRTCFADDASVFFPAPEPSGLFEGGAALEERFTQVFERVRANAVSGPPFHRLVPQRLRISLLGPTAACATFELRDATRFARRTIVFRRVGSRWLIAHLHASNAAPAEVLPKPAPPGEEKS